MSQARREQLVDLSVRAGFLIVADEAYQLLAYYDRPPAAFGTLIDSDTVLSLGSFSKILAPALRLGWIQTSPVLMKKLRAGGLSNSGGSINHYASHVVRQALDLGLQTAHLEFLRTALRSRLEVMDAALQQRFGSFARWHRPEGGYFFWLIFDERLDTAPLKALATQRQTGFQPGTVFSSCNHLGHCLRLSFAHYSEQDINEGIGRLRTLFDPADTKGK